MLESYQMPEKSNDVDTSSFSLFPHYQVYAHTKHTCIVYTHLVSENEVYIPEIRKKM